MREYVCEIEGVEGGSVGCVRREGVWSAKGGVCFCLC